MDGALTWHYVLLGEDAFHDWRKKGARLSELLDYARVRPLVASEAQASLLSRARSALPCISLLVRGDLEE